MPSRLLLGLLLCSLLGCGSNTPAPVEDRYARRVSSSSSSTYYVQRGDTLYSIAFRYGLDYRRIAAANRIPLPYTIYPGQKILLQEGALPTPGTVAKTRGTPIASSPGTPAATPSPASARTPSPKAAVPAPAKSTVKKPAPVTKTSPVSRKKSSSGGTYTGGTVTAWRWPTSGSVIRGYSSSVHKGIDIAGKRGDPVQAVAAGKVVYAGTGIVGFGELLIIKHNEVYLSAYGHNDRLLVREGETVKAGQRIAVKGSSGTDIVKLHFEIRKEGKPVDPQRLLPKR